MGNLLLGAGKASVGEASRTPAEPVEVVHISESEGTSRNVFDVVWSIGLATLAGRRDDDGGDSDEATSIPMGRL